jgi:signal transduction histidine kinase/Fe-S-cluster-containing hydrogenase component 2
MPNGYVTTIRERCRMCYTCIRECPAKAIRVKDGQAEVIPDRCIACGNCLRVCSQQAKQYPDSVAEVEDLLRSDRKVIACLAPSFPAEFHEIGEGFLVGMTRRLGFDHVCEVSFGADLVARRYRQLLDSNDGQRHIATSCPAVVAYIQRFYPQLVPSLIPVVSPMVATARAARRLYGDDVAIVFVGPCVGKKMEGDSDQLEGDMDAVLTFGELRRLFRSRAIEAESVLESDFDPPYGGLGGLLPIGRGMLQAADLPEDLKTGEIVAVEGHNHVREAIKEFAAGDLGARLLEALCCEGCIMGAGIENNLPLFNRRRRVREYVCRREERTNHDECRSMLTQMDDLDLSRTFTIEDRRIPDPAAEDIQTILAEMGKHSPKDELNCGACGYDTCREHAVAIHQGLAENAMCLPHSIENLSRALEQVEQSNQRLANAQEALAQSEKLASVGQLAAGVAHEVNNPLGAVLMYSHLMRDECPSDSPIREDIELVIEQAGRCKKIVAGLLDFARQNKVAREPTNLNELVQRTVRTTPVPEGIQIDVRQLSDSPAADVDQDQIVQVLTNLIGNAVDAMDGQGTIRIELDGDERGASFRVRDTGEGIPEENLKKVFEPFFTTKRVGEGTGLGLAVTYGIVKMHGGDIHVQSNADAEIGPTGTTFTVTLPRLR